MAIYVFYLIYALLLYFDIVPSWHHSVHRRLNFAFYLQLLSSCDWIYGRETGDSYAIMNPHQTRIDASPRHNKLSSEINFISDMGNSRRERSDKTFSTRFIIPHCHLALWHCRPLLQYKWGNNEKLSQTSIHVRYMYNCRSSLFFQGLDGVGVLWPCGRSSISGLLAGSQ